MRLRALLVLVAAGVLTVGLPLAGLAIAGQPLGPYLHFPPRTEYVAHAAFAWRAFLAMAVPVAGAIGLIAMCVAGARPAPAAPDARPFPMWGWLGAALIAGAWPLAWVPGLVPVEWRRQTFGLLWMGYVLAINGLIERRHRRPPLTGRGRMFAALFAVSAGFWWAFEYLNQFVRNWYYTGISPTSAVDYFLQGSLPFSTVLPAVISTSTWIDCSLRFDSMSLPALGGHRLLPWLALFSGAFGLAAIGIWPELLYPLLWLAPLLVLLGLQHLLLGRTRLTPLARGDWQPLVSPALAALACGVCWELWNVGSLAKWQYSIPYVQRFHLFEMPLLGYAGYLPFGLECAVVADLVSIVVDGRPLRWCDGGPD